MTMIKKLQVCHCMCETTHNYGSQECTEWGGGEGIQKETTIFLWWVMSQCKMVFNQILWIMLREFLPEEHI